MKHRWPVLTLLLAVLVAAAAWAQTPAPVAVKASTVIGGVDQQQPPPPPPPPPPKTATAPKVIATPAPPDPPAAPAAPERRRTPSQLVNVKIELTITDQVGDNPPQKKNIVMVVADGERGSIRTRAEFVKEVGGAKRGFGLPLSADAAPEIEGNKVRLRLSLEYDLIGDSGAGPEGELSIRESLAVIAEHGVPLVVALSADPMSDRKVSLEVRASILK